MNHDHIWSTLGGDPNTSEGSQNFRNQPNNQLIGLKIYRTIESVALIPNMINSSKKNYCSGSYKGFYIFFPFLAIFPFLKFGSHLNIHNYQRIRKNFKRED